MEKIKNLSKNTIIEIGIIAVGFFVLLAVILIITGSNKTITCTIENELIDGFKNNEEITIKIKKKKLKSIKMDRTISINEFYQEYGTYTDSLKTVLTNGYEYLSPSIKESKSNVKVSFEIEEKGIVLNNLTITRNSDTDKTSLRYDITKDYKIEKNSIKIGDKYTKKELKSKLQDLGYTCK